MIIFGAFNRYLTIPGGLSLIELLMTVAILAILAARLLPFSGAKPRALQVTDPSNERQSPLGLAMYGARERGA